MRNTFHLEQGILHRGGILNSEDPVDCTISFLWNNSGVVDQAPRPPLCKILTHQGIHYAGIRKIHPLCRLRYFIYDSLSDDPESRVCFASKNLTPCGMHWNESAAGRQKKVAMEFREKRKFVSLRPPARKRREGQYRSFEKTYQNSLWRKAEQMHAMWLCMYSSS